MEQATHIRRPRASSWHAALALWVAVAAACGDDAEQRPTQSESDAGFRDAAAPVLSEGCDEDAGTECEDGYNCIDGRCEHNTCGDGIVAGREQCDDGNEAIGDGCDPACRPEPPPSCGDAQVQEDEGEECDDGNRYDADACSNACTENECGNARVDVGEECDDGDVFDDNECSNMCTENRCRNGRLDPGEQCDDGNRIHDDGCTNACMIVVCGNAILEGEEECDDGNDVDDDACANACTANVCGNRRIDPGEACDGDTVEYACMADCSGMADDECRPCEDEHCTTFQGADWVAGCFEGNVPPELVPEVDPNFAQDCIDAVNCARRTGCVGSTGHPLACYCGDQTLDACNLDGPTDDAPCVDEWRAATRGANNIEILTNLSDIMFPSGWVYYLLQCDYMRCAAECTSQ